MTIQTPEPVGFVVTLKDVYDQMQAGFRQLSEISGHLQAVNSAQTAAAEHRQDLESRVRTLESAKGRIYGALALLSVLFGGGGVWAAIALVQRPR